MRSRSDAEIAAQVAQDIPDGTYVNLGIGKSTQVADHLPSGRQVVYHAESGILGMGPAPTPGQEDAELIDASKRLVFPS